MRDFLLDLARLALSEARRCRTEGRSRWVAGYLNSAAHYRRKAREAGQ